MYQNQIVLIGLVGVMQSRITEGQYVNRMSLRLILLCKYEVQSPISLREIELKINTGIGHGKVIMDMVIMRQSKTNYQLKMHLEMVQMKNVKNYIIILALYHNF